MNGIVYCVPRIWPSKWITPLWAAGVRVFLEVVVVILVVISELVTQGGIKEGVVCRLGALHFWSQKVG